MGGVINGALVNIIYYRVHDRGSRHRSLERHSSSGDHTLTPDNQSPLQTPTGTKGIKEG